MSRNGTFCSSLSIQVHSVQQVQKNWTHSTCMQDKTLSVPSQTTSSTTAHGNRTQGPQRTHQVEVSGECEEQEEAETDIADIVRVHAVSPSVPRSYKVSLEINKIPITMELDTGASVSLVSEATWADKLNRPQLQPCTRYLCKVTHTEAWKCWGSYRWRSVYMGRKPTYRSLWYSTIWQELAGTNQLKLGRNC